MVISYQLFLNSELSLKHISPWTSKTHYAFSPTNTTGNIPDIYFTASKKPTKLNETCAYFPQLFDIKIKNNYWQTQKTDNGTFNLFNAYLDRREGSVIRIIGTYSQLHPQDEFFCQLWYDNQHAPVIVPTEPLLWMFLAHWGADTNNFDHPYLITCALTDTRVPTSVSLVGDPCDNATNNVKIFSTRVSTKKNFVVCVKGLSFPFEDKSARLAEWIELLNILGAEKIQFYEFSVDANSKQILDYYSGLGRIEVTPLTLVGDVSNSPFLQSMYLHEKMIKRRLQEVIPYNDCLYKHIEEFKFAVLLDIDEVIVPVRNTWIELMRTLQEQTPRKSSYVARNVYFLDTHLHRHKYFQDIPRYMHMLQHVYRAQNYTKPGYFVKGFHDLGIVKALHNHYPFACLGACSSTEINTEWAQLQHYRADCVAEIGNCNSMTVNNVLDTRVWNFKDELIERVQTVFRDLQMFEDQDQEYF
ncbi:hypothetical protein Zmor_017708 [Zophobas morio]|uniref:Glycosyltransferase family 92 protein n=1 Tax=Zophobas morio TaxID=2755281 RepID=A0AA38IC03_9CUCU|nr:hypothetical protein Zmor_017708 [Zophobas morio]